mmetsp:Transcript_17559/g.30540  ORF Transcript_17559/g.30540 Transcript_17559/m.30540 type:complete len:105 (-) Transcript_17559:152-466(-)|eukprot:CAMPEP_0184692192 /NCGR_PEP_ID=MMETSP0313-20130426/774_1 /TAXON_ID=2792 /ORGANISM="Porphyridium aerugineum, Strain SAG 1380-2" /LENGTH=104 /DNA_ID=CAMNT_0027150005 /DNA_START=58 /DNA_END=372 /DNA_ORIENTATION=+
MSSWGYGSGSKAGSASSSSSASRPPSEQEQAKLLAEIQQLQAQAESQVRVQEALAEITEKCWDKCMGKPGAKLTSSEESCFANCAERFLESSLFIQRRLLKDNR